MLLTEYDDILTVLMNPTHIFHTQQKLFPKESE